MSSHLHQIITGIAIIYVILLVGEFHARQNIAIIVIRLGNFLLLLVTFPFQWTGTATNFWCCVSKGANYWDYVTATK